MEILSKQRLAYLSSLTNLNEQRRSFSRSEAKKSVFISHKHSDIKECKHVINLLKNLDIAVYIDKLDDGMPEITSAKTAERIKSKIRDNDKFILIATDDAISSKWCNWELGYGDSQKKDNGNLALFPIRNNGADWNGSEYLELYPCVIYEDGLSDYFAKDNDDFGVYYVQISKPQNAPSMGKIPRGYYCRFQEEYEDTGFFLNFYIPLKGWLLADKIE